MLNTKPVSLIDPDQNQPRKEGADVEQSEIVHVVIPAGNSASPSIVAHAGKPGGGNAKRPTLILTPDAERVQTEAFRRTNSVPEYREPLQRLYSKWRFYNETFFEGKLAVPHIGIAKTGPRRFSECDHTTDYGGMMNILIAARVVFGTDQKLVKTKDLTTIGLWRFIFDLLLGETVKQFVLEVLGDGEEGWRGRGPLFCREANRIGELLGLPVVEPRRRAFRGMGQPVAAFWPWALRPEGYYLGDVRLDHLQVAGLRPQARFARHAAVPGIYEYFLYLLARGQTARLTDVLGRVVDAEKEARSPAVAAFERGPHDASGMPLPMPLIDPDWLTWNGGCVRAIAEGIRTRRAFDGALILADALSGRRLRGRGDSGSLPRLTQTTPQTAGC